MAGSLIERRKWAMSRDEQGYREYSILWQVNTSNPLYGPLSVANTPGMPLPGSFWQFGGEVDPWAYCTPYLSVKPYYDDEACVFWTVEQKFTTKPQTLQNCSSTNIDNPLLIPPRVSGSFVRFQREATHDRYGNLLKSSSHEQFRGDQVTFDAHSAQVTVEVNSATLPLSTITLSAMNRVNSLPMWGLAARLVKLSEFSWSKHIYGTCGFYYTYSLGFEINVFDRQVVDEGNNVLNGHWDREETTGSGCTLDITADSNGQITAAAVNAGGTGYAADATITLQVVSPPGVAGRVTVLTNGSGVVTSVVRVSSAGFLYSSASGVTTARASGWILDDIDGGPPDKDNPQHFIRATDLKGDPMRFLLNGGGEPLEDGADPYVFNVEKYGEYNFFLLGIPVTL